MEGIKVFVRVRPLALNNCERPQDNNDHRLATRISTSSKEISVHSLSRQVTCKYDHIFGENCTQVEVFGYVKSSVNAALNGINSTIFAYGQTSSGKTHTMFGKDSCIFDDPGIVPRCIHEIFKVASHAKGSFSIFVSFIQIYNEQVFDMLDDPERRKPLNIHERLNESNVTISGLTEYQVHSYKQCLALTERGIKNRTIRETNMNNASSRSHTILQITIEQYKIKETSGKRTLLCSKLNLVDLAGSERWIINDDAMGEGQISELKSINSSLYTLGRCIAALAKRPQNSKSTPLDALNRHVHIPFRDSKLTRILQDSIGGNSKTFLVATINPSFVCSEESISTLRFADRAHQVMTHFHVNEVSLPDDSNEVIMLRKEVMRLRSLLEANGLSHNGKVIINDYTSPNHECCIESKIPFQKEIDEHHEVKEERKEKPNAPNDIITIRQDSPVTTDDAEIRNYSDTCLQRVTCKRIIDALSAVLLNVDLFLKTVNRTPKPKDKQHISESLSLIQNNEDRLKRVNKGVAVRDVNHVFCKNKSIEPFCDNIEVQTRKIIATTNSFPQQTSFKSNSLSTLLQKRRELNRIHSKDDEEDLKLREELRRARRQKDQKLQLKRWLNEKEKYAENPIAY